MKSGFTIIELIVATLIASMIASLLLTALAQGNRSRVSIDNMISFSERIAIISNQLEKDLSGAFIPVQAQQQQSEKSDTQTDADTKEDKTQDTAKSQEQSVTGEKKKPKPIEKIFFSSNKENMLDSLTFITNNPLVVFVGKDVGTVKPKIARVQYTLRPEANRKDSYALFRQESTELDVENYKNVRAYEVIGGIKSCTVTFTARIEKKEEPRSTSDKKEQPKISYEYRTMKEWVSEHKKNTQQQADKKESELPHIPYLVEFKITLWNMQDTKDKEYTFVCEIPVIKQAEKKEDKKLTSPQEQAKEPNANKNPQNKGKQQKGAATNSEGSSEGIVVYNGVEVLAESVDVLKKIMGHLG